MPPVIGPRGTPKTIFVGKPVAQPSSKFLPFAIFASGPDAETFRRIQPFFMLAVRCGEVKGRRNTCDV
jgi:hypothetical protein